MLAGITKDAGYKRFENESYGDQLIHSVLLHHGQRLSSVPIEFGMKLYIVRVCVFVFCKWFIILQLFVIKPAGCW